MKTPGQIVSRIAGDLNSQYADDRWSRRRADFFSHNGRQCQSCQRTDTETQLHHRYYERGRALWDYDDFDLVCLCKSCHGLWHKTNNFYRKEIACNCNVTDLAGMMGALHALIKAHSQREVFFALVGLKSDPATFRNLRMLVESAK